MYRINQIFALSIVALIALALGACQPLTVLVPEAELAPETLLGSETAAKANPLPSYTPEYMSSDCLYRIPPGEDVSCGFLLVPEDRSQPGGLLVRLHVVIFNSTNPEPSPTPLILLNGGPGAPGMPLVEAILETTLGRVWRSQRDVVYFDQRGSNFAVPSLYCPELAIDPAVVVAQPYVDSMELRMQRLTQCYARLAAEDVNLSAYNLVESAADINDLRIVLGYDKVDIYGFSYGSLLALTVMRTYPENLRSVVLDAIWPPGVDLTHESAETIRSGLDALFAGCKADPNCHEAYPDLETVFYAVANRLRAAPVEVEMTVNNKEHTIYIDDLKLIQYVFGGIQVGEMAYLPQELYTAYEGNYEPIASMLLKYAYGGSHEPIPGYRGAAFGMYYSTMCSYADCFEWDDAGTRRENQVANQEEFQLSLLDYSDWSFQACNFWEVGPLASDRAIEPVVSDIPTLMLTGRYDCGLPPYLSQQLASSLVNSFYFELPVGHTGALTSCGLDLVTHFLNEPEQEPESSCIAQMKVNWIAPLRQEEELHADPLELE